jgi:hypothetical protein
MAKLFRKPLGGLLSQILREGYVERSLGRSKAPAGQHG